MEGLDPYEVLGVAHDAEEQQIRASFQRLALLWHPDRCHDAEATRRFQLIHQAYQILSDPSKRELLGESSKVASEQLDLSTFTFDSSSCTYCLDCRCGGVYELTSEDLKEGYDTVQCSSCSLHVTVS